MRAQSPAVKPLQLDPSGLSLPNTGSKVQTAASLLIDVRYARMFVERPWDWDRFLRLCAFLKLMPAEQASIVRMPHSDLPLFERDLRIPNARRGPVELLLEQFERHHFERLKKSPAENVFPDLPPHAL